jgi:hypothetical protein
MSVQLIVILLALAAAAAFAYFQWQARQDRDEPRARPGRTSSRTTTKPAKKGPAKKGPATTKRPPAVVDDEDDFDEDEDDFADLRSPLDRSSGRRASSWADEDLVDDEPVARHDLDDRDRDRDLDDRDLDRDLDELDLDDRQLEDDLDEDRNALGLLSRLDEARPAEVDRFRSGRTAVDDEFASLTADVELEADYEAELEAEYEAEAEAVEAPIKEDVESADDIMEASKQTEINPAGNAELQRLLQKVQARLTAYE